MTWRLHIKKLEAVSLVTFVILTLSMVGFSVMVMVLFDVEKQNFEKGLGRLKVFRSRYRIALIPCECGNLILLST